MDPWGLLALLPLLAGLLSACAGSPPEIVDYAPERGSVNVRTNEPIRITFDRAMDAASVADRLHLLPATEGRVAWESPRQLTYLHPSLRPDTAYEVRLEAGYRDAAGNANSLRHRWPFRTEPPPALTAGSPANGEQGVDPASLITLTFSREMDPASLPAAISIAPFVPLSLRLESGDRRRVLVAPSVLLEPGSPYSVAVTPDARDIDGNALAAGAVVSFSTGPRRPLQHWVSFLAQSAGEPAAAGVWIVDENRLPRRLYAGLLAGFSWSGSGDRLLLALGDRRWAELGIGSDPRLLAFRADWAAALDPARGYLYLDQGGLYLQPPNGAAEELASGVGEAAVAPNGTRVAFTTSSGSLNEIRALDVQLRTEYRLQTEPGPIRRLTWSPNGQHLAYLVLGSDPGSTLLRVRNLDGGGRSLTVAAGELDSPFWLADSSHLLVSATLSTSGGRLQKAFRLSAAGMNQLSAGQGLPAGPLPVHDPRPSPDGHQVAFVADDGQLWLMNADGTGAVQLTSYDPAEFPYSCREPAWTRS